MQFIDPEKDTLGSGTWVKKNGELFGDSSGPKNRYSSVGIMYAPPEEYDFRIEFTRTEGNDLIAQSVTSSGSEAWPAAGIQYYTLS